ncbi:hypothetical protein N0V82_006465 [Gnomoniopsis sp. IMI 355080]|nr:hypothetical protein N0V82_006465 [Gnomoniopsis sp. IMI 355080]
MPARTTLPQLEAQFYIPEKLRKLLTCLVKETTDLRPRTMFDREEETRYSIPVFTVAHYTVREFLYSKKAVEGPTSYFAVLAETDQLLELRIVFDGLHHFNPSPKSAYKPIRYEDYYSTPLIFTANDLHLQGSRDDILFRALSGSYSRHGRGDRDDRTGNVTLGFLKELLEHGADPSPSDFKVTPLQFAMYWFEQTWVHRILELGTDVKVIGDITGVDPFPRAEQFRDREWYRYKALEVCTLRELDCKLTSEMQQGVKRLIKQHLGFLSGEIIVWN